ncbi:hypothetical protein QYE76_056874 [Lolium multiflorum]|uniref:Transposase (putative) gypsy type domain-containing protein n=1 Tax=Lolium multiflorum TaxID=4521 RepID=A0AAD8T403_LOLMU|nr:hypothetical protein QYE76_056874 [Lolium multiflorum]
MPRGGIEASTALFFLLALCFHLSPRARARRRSGERFPLANSGGRFFTDPPPPLHQSGATGPRVSTERPQPPLSPPRSQGSSSPFSLSCRLLPRPRPWRLPADRGGALTCGRTTSSAGAPPADPAVGDHAGARRGVGAHAEPGERVVFGAHLDRGLGLPASTFFRRFLDHFGLQPHHLPANACVLLSCFVAFMEAYAGLWPDIDFWSRLFYEGPNQRRPPAGLRRRLDLHPAWYAFPQNPHRRLVGRINWSHNARSTDQNAEVNLLWDFLATAAGGLTAEDLLCTIAERRVLPLQMRTHKIGHMSGRFDPNRTSKVLLNKAQVASRVNHITKANLSEDWSYGLAPCDRDHPPARLFERRASRMATWRRGGGRRITSIRLTKPATRPATTTCRRRLPRRPGERNPPPSPEQQEEEEPATSGTGPSLPCLCVCPGRRLPASSARCVAASPRRREQTPQPSSRAPTPPPLRVLRLPRAPSFAVPLASAPDRGTRAEPARRVTLDDMFPGRTRLRLLGWPGMPPSTGAGASSSHRPRPGRAGRGCAAYGGVGRKPGGDTPSAETTGRPAICAGATRPRPAATEEPARREPAKDEPARTERRLARVGEDGNLIGIAAGLHVAKGALLLRVPSASDASLGSAATMEQAWLAPTPTR